MKKQEREKGWKSSRKVEKVVGRWKGKGGKNVGEV